MTMDDAIKAALLFAGLASAGGAGSYFGGETVNEAAVEGWCGEALSIQADHYREEIEDLEEEMEGLEDECAGPN